MKLLILGAAGETGSRLIREAAARGHEVNAFARSAAKVLAKIGGATANIAIVEGDAGDEAALAAAMGGQDAVINAAGNAWDGESFAPLVQRVLRVADAALGEGGRFWFFGGAGVLDIPGTRLMGIDLPGVPKLYRAHRANLDAARATRLDWSMLCPGPMVAAEDGRAHEGLRLAAETWPFPAPMLARIIGGPALSLAFARRMGELTITYEDAAKVILDHLAKGGPFARNRVGVALPEGMRLRKNGGGGRR